MSVTYKDNSRATLSALDAAIHRALEIIGGTAETYAKSLIPVRTGNLRNSIAHAGSAFRPAGIRQKNRSLISSNPR